ncbi:xanthine dehydrogenase family protein molybdopterin-binding subunit [Kluyvera sp. STS39-E]|uniref:xanthine dehydrogenase family protein molybdopterin-binding subunit n=1 Tax=Enterobacteriaceae TaxID=543 RepID=UPI000E3DD194|nr:MULTISPECIES: xanthine dehydrogenase family protein molybdopterin-binding subunit [Citrobacter]MBD0826614.1 xanthine dehydrogenase family protein molybdopterin-binding subunit [Citrobacter sp. C1]RFU93336.1 xanthine dehydrogenase family protein molybdopterin-binding subunit [Citrobacter gillenii]
MNSKNTFNKSRRTLLKASAIMSAVVGTGLRLRPASAAEARPGIPTAPLSREIKYQALGIGRERADGLLKIQGQARYAIEHNQENMAYGVIVQSTIASGTITGVDTKAARLSPGVVAVYSHLDKLKLNPAKVFLKGGAATEAYTPLQDEQIKFNGQHVAIVIAETFEQATYAASLVKIFYHATPAILQPEDPRTKPQLIDALNVAWGNAEQALSTAPVVIKGVYTTPREYNTPIEPHACIASWKNGEITVWEPTQWVGGARQVISEWMGLGIEKVRIISPFTGGGFGSKVSPHAHVALACLASRELDRPIKVSLTRQQTFTGYGGRPRTRQELSLGAHKDGRLVSIVHNGWNETSIDDVHLEPTNNVTPIMYACDNVWARHSIIPVNTVNPGWMRAPGENPSAFALEIAMDELAYELNMDPLALRLLNWANHDYKSKTPWSTRQLREAYAAGADAFGWSKRTAAPRSMRRGRELIGWGMAAGTYPVIRSPAEARIILHVNGEIVVESGGTDIGTGTYTILAQTAAEVLGVSSHQITVRLGDTRLPRSPVAGGSQLANVLTGAVHKTAVAVKERLITLAISQPDSPLYQAQRSNVTIGDGQISLLRRPGKGISFSQLIALTGHESMDVKENTYKPGATEQERYDAAHTFTQIQMPGAFDTSSHSWSAQFVEVAVDEDFGTVRVKRMLGAFDCGRVYNPKLAESQWIGGMVMGLGQALLEEGMHDPRDGRITNASLAEYVVPVNADVPDIQVISVGVPDYQASALGGKAVGEVGIVGVAAAISNAVFHATGKRVRDLPLTMDKLL